MSEQQVQFQPLSLSVPDSSAQQSYQQLNDQTTMGQQALLSQILNSLLSGGVPPAQILNILGQSKSMDGTIKPQTPSSTSGVNGLTSGINSLFGKASTQSTGGLHDLNNFLSNLFNPAPTNPNPVTGPISPSMITSANSFGAIPSILGPLSSIDNSLMQTNTFSGLGSFLGGLF